MKRIYLSLAVLLSACSAVPPTLSDQMFFDDFSYTSSRDAALTRHGWTIREGVGGPGVPGTWSKNNISFLKEQNQSLMRLTAYTSGNDPQVTGQAEIYGPLVFFEGTYAARVRFSDDPIKEASGKPGPDGDAVVQTFFTISDPAMPDDPAFDASKYSELDFEYLPNGSIPWNRPKTTLLTTSWAAYKNEPYVEEQNPVASEQSYAGWHTVVVTAHSGKVTYFVDGKKLAQHDGKWYPDSQMRLDMNLWFIRRGILDSTEKRTYQQDVDWVMHVKNQALSPQQVDAQVQALQSRKIKFLDYDD